jgi:16S rRNA processing protein RimM
VPVPHARTIACSSRSSTDLSDEFVSVGRVGRPHGLDGSFFVERPSEDAERFARGATLYVDGEPAKVASSKRGSGGRPVIKLDREVPRGAELSVRRADLPPTEEGEYYAFQLVGLMVAEDGGRELGRVENVAQGVANDVLELDSGVALPLVEACVREIDLDGGRIVVATGFVEPPLP